MLHDNIQPNLNISREVIDGVNTDIKITSNTKMNHIMASSSDDYNSIFIGRIPYKHKNWQFHGVLITSFQRSLFSPHMRKVNFSA